MKPCKIILFSLFFLLSCYCGAQPLEAKWSDKQFYENSKDGFFSNYIGGNTRFVYALYANKTKRTKRERLRLAAFSGGSMKELGAVTLIDRRKPEERKKYADLTYVRTLVYENHLFVFWINQTRYKAELFVERYDEKLNRTGELKKIYQTPEELKSMRYARVFIAGSRRVSTGFIAGVDFRGDEEQDPVLDYKVLDSSLSVTFSGRQTIKVEGAKPDLFSAVYQYGDDGNLHVEMRVYPERSRRKEESAYTVYSLISPSENLIKTIPLKFENKNVFDVGIVTEKNVVKIFGFFCDLVKDPRGEDTHGIFYCIINSTSRQITHSNFSYFSREQLDKLFSKDEEDRRDRRVFTGRNRMVSEEESLGSFYQIEDVVSADSNDIVLFCSMMRNISRVSCDNRGICNTYYYCYKSNVTAFRISADGTIVWASNLDRFITYDGWDIKDVHVICPDKKNFYVTYGSVYLAGKESKNFFSRKSGRHARDFFEYGVFDYATGSFRKEELRLNAQGISRREIKMISPLAVQTHDNKFYVHSIQVAPKPWVCATAVVFPVYLVLLSTGSSYRGAGYLGTINPAGK
jgi:hypothetical protein